ncbi:MAG: hypothetical protein JW946_05470 [Candidatus Omnitrophica bacterium]|nr:hypothetical protein [Candidatus Omnitrophota bacterium]
MPTANFRKTGFALIAVILLMSFIAITTMSLTVFIIERLRLASARENEINAYYMAQAGGSYAIYRYRRNGRLSGTYDSYPDRGFSWTTTRALPNIIITSTGYCPKSGAGIIQKRLQGTYNMTTQRLTEVKYID